MESHHAYIALGSNLGDRLSHLQFAVDRLRSDPGIEPISISSVFEAAAHVLPGHEAQSSYLNAVVEVRSLFDPVSLLKHLLQIESDRGRRRRADLRWEPRVLDLDLIVMGTQAFETAELTLPHPRLAERAFVLDPLVEIAADLHIPPPFDATVRYLRDNCKDTASIAKSNLTLSISSANESV